jgi:hypothetical protein
LARGALRAQSGEDFGAGRRAVRLPGHKSDQLSARQVVSLGFTPGPVDTGLAVVYSTNAIDLV